MSASLQAGDGAAAPGGSARPCARPLALLCGALLGVTVALAPPAGADPAPTIRVSSAAYLVPDVNVVRSDGTRVALRQAIDDGRATVLNFIFTSCAAICPLTSQVFASLQSKLGTERQRVHLVSISIDPEEDTPARLTEYATRFHAGPSWDYYTGTPQSSVTIQRAFNAYRGDKMNHAAVTLLRGAPGLPWVRIEGLATADELLEQVRRLKLGS